MTKVLALIAALTLGYIVGVNTTGVSEREWQTETAKVYAKCLPSRGRHKWSEAAIDASIKGLKTIPERRLP